MPASSTNRTSSRPAPVTAEDKRRLLESARTVRERAYAPYSKFHVGAAVLTDKGKIYAGCNVENASYGLTICAERSAIAAAVAAEGAETKLRAIIVLNGNDAPCSPCGACRQVIYEFGPEAVVIFQGRSGLEESTASQLLPAGFSL